MFESLSAPQRAVLKALHLEKTGLTPEALAERLGLTRTAVRQQLWTLERGGLVEQAKRRYRLTARGHDLFPKRYSWFSEALVEAAIAEKGRKEFRRWIGGIGQAVSKQLGHQIRGKDVVERVRQTARLLNEMDHEARFMAPSEEGGLAAIEAGNCVYHSVAGKHPEVCEMDIALLSGLTGMDVTLQKCIAKGENVCRFSFECKKKRRVKT